MYMWTQQSKAKKILATKFTSMEKTQTMHNLNMKMDITSKKKIFTTKLASRHEKS